MKAQGRKPVPCSRVPQASKAVKPGQAANKLRLQAFSNENACQSSWFWQAFSLDTPTTRKSTLDDDNSNVIKVFKISKISDFLKNFAYFLGKQVFEFACFNDNFKGKPKVKSPPVIPKSFKNPNGIKTQFIA